MKTTKIEKPRGGLTGCQIKSELVPAMHNGKIHHWVPLVDLNAADLHIITRKQIKRQLADGLIPILSAPHLSDQSSQTNRCATVLKTKTRSDVVYGLLMPGGNKKRIFNRMVKEERPIIATLVGTGLFMPDATDRGRLVIDNVQYIRLDFTK